MAKVKVKLIKSLIGSKSYQKSSVFGLGLSKLGQVVEVEDISLDLLKEKDLIKNSTKIVKIIKDIESCPKLNIKGLKATSSVKKLIMEAGGTLEE